MRASAASVIRASTALLAVFGCIVVGASAEEDDGASIFGTQGLRLQPNDESDLRLLEDRYVGRPGFDFLLMRRSPSEPVEVLVAPQALAAFKAELEARGIRYEVYIEDFGEHVSRQFAERRRANARRAVALLTMGRGALAAATTRGGKKSTTSRRDISFKSFPSYGEITGYLEYLAKKRSDLVELFSIGKSYEGRDILGVKISSGGAAGGYDDGAEEKPAIVIDAGIHAREWIAPTTALYAIKQLAENASNAWVLENVDFYVIPSLNPDGYEYTQRSVSTRMWRKTRSVTQQSRCVGVDANRNFGYKWMVVGASSNPCSDTYAGSAPFSEPETAALRDFILSKKGVIKSYLTFHSYGNYFLHPWGFTEDLPENEPTLSCVARKAEKALSKIRGTRYTIGSSTNVLYAAAGGSDDWAMAVGGAELVYTIELPGGRYGFAPPTSEIVPVGVETFEAIKMFARYVEGGICQ